MTKQRQQQSSQGHKASTRRVVVFVTGNAAMAGVEFNAIRLADKLDRKRWRVVLVCPQEGDLPDAFRQAGLEVRILPRPRLFSTSIALGGNRRIPNPVACVWDVGAFFIAARRLATLLSQIGPDLVFTKGMFPHFYGALAARSVDVPCLWHAEDFISERCGGLFRRFFGQAALRLPAAVAAIGEPIAQQLPFGVQTRVRVIHNAVDTDNFRPGEDGRPIRTQFGIPENALVVGHVARLTPWKGQRYLLEAFAQVAKQIHDARLLFVGSPLFDSDSFEQSLRARAVSLGLADRVVFAGHQHDVAPVLAAMDVLGYPSIEKDNCPLALLEGMAAGLPVVAFDIPGIRLVVNDSQDGVLVPVGRADLLGKAILRLFADPELRRRLASAARRRIEEAFSLERQVNSFETLFSALTQKRNSVASISQHQ